MLKENSVEARQSNDDTLVTATIFGLVAGAVTIGAREDE